MHLKKGDTMSQYALLKRIGRNEYVVVKHTDNCLGVLAYFLTDGGSKDNFCSWIEKTKKGETVGEAVFIRKDGDDIVIGLDPVMTGRQDQFGMKKEDLLSYIDCWKKEQERNADEVLIKRQDSEITFDGKVITGGE